MVTREDKRGHKASVVLAKGALVVSIDHAELQVLVDKCLRETGKVTFGLQEVSVTRLGDLTDASVIVN